MKPQKRECSSKYRDRLSEMPDEVIVHILSYMSTFDAVRTMLIRPFGTLWTLVPTLKFEAQEVVSKMAPDGNWGSNANGRFYIFVRNVLMLHKRPFIDKFQLLLGWLCEDTGREAGDNIRMCLSFALDKQAKEIYFSDVNFELTNSSDFSNFTSQSLVTLELSYCSIICPQLQVNLGSLKKLIFYKTDMCEEALEQFVCGSPSLQELHILETFSLKNLRFSAPNIHKLSLGLFEDEKSDDTWVVDFPNLKTLELEMMRIPDVIDVSSLRDVYLKWLYVDVDDENELRMFNLFLEKFSRCEVFRLSLNASEPFFHSIDDSHALQIRWKCVVLGLRIFCQSCLLGFYQLMRSTKHLEELTIVTDATLTYESVCNTPDLFSGQAFRAGTDLPPVELSYPCVMPKLKTVTLHGYAKPWKHQLQLIEFILKSAIVLEKMVIVLKKHQGSSWIFLCMFPASKGLHVSGYFFCECYGCFSPPHSTRLHNYGFLGDLSYGICSLIVWRPSFGRVQMKLW